MNGNCFDYPNYIFVDENHSVYVSDYENDRVMKLMKDATERIIIVGGQGQLSFWFSIWSTRKSLCHR